MDRHNTVGIQVPLPGGQVYDTTFPVIVFGEYFNDIEEVRQALNV